MTKLKVNYICKNCGDIKSKWSGKCSVCFEWNTIEENSYTKNSSLSTNNRISITSKILNLDEIKDSKYLRISSGISEFDRVLGGGLVPGAVILIGGDPGIGKSTLLLQVLSNLSKNNKALYISGEESSLQISLRAERLKIKKNNLNLKIENNLEAILNVIMEFNPQIMVIDSIQTLYSDLNNSVPGSILQVRECTAQLTRLAKSKSTTIIIVGHVTKDGGIAGPKIIEHIVDTVLYFEGDSNSNYRLIRASKNRFGAVNEIGIFAMTEIGLKQVSNPSAIFLSGYSNQVSGSCIMVTQEGSRNLLVEIQALVDQSNIPNSRRLTVGLEQNRLSMLLAVFHKHAKIALFDKDIFINAVGGVKISEPASDLPVLLAINSSLNSKPLPKGLISFGEVGLSGEIRPAPKGQERLKEAFKLGFSYAIIPIANKPKVSFDGMKIYAIEKISDIQKTLKLINQN